MTDVYDYLVIASTRMIRAIVTTEPIASSVVAEDSPGTGVTSDADISRSMGKMGNSAHHQGDTCKMGSDAMAVVDERLPVRGIEGLRLVDATIMPFLRPGNTNAPTIKIGVKAAAMIRQDAVPRRSMA